MISLYFRDFDSDVEIDEREPQSTLTFFLPS